MPTIQEALDRIWSDDSLKQRLLAHPKPVLREFGLNISDTTAIQIHENTITVFNAVLPMQPAAKVSLADGDPVQQIIEQAWSDPGFKARLLANPDDVAREMGLKIPSGVTLKVWENTPAVEHMILPLNPNQSELSDMELEAVAGGSSSKGGSPGPASCAIAGGVAIPTLGSPFLPGAVPDPIPTGASSFSAPSSGKG